MNALKKFNSKEDWFKRLDKDFKDVKEKYKTIKIKNLMISKEHLNLIHMYDEKIYKQKNVSKKKKRLHEEEEKMKKTINKVNLNNYKKLLKNKIINLTNEQIIIQNILTKLDKNSPLFTPRDKLIIPKIKGFDFSKYDKSSITKRNIFFSENRADKRIKLNLNGYKENEKINSNKIMIENGNNKRPYIYNKKLKSMMNLISEKENNFEISGRKIYENLIQFNKTSLLKLKEIKDKAKDDEFIIINNHKLYYENHKLKKRNIKPELNYLKIKSFDDIENKVLMTDNCFIQSKLNIYKLYEKRKTIFQSEMDKKQQTHSLTKYPSHVGFSVGPTVK